MFIENVMWSIIRLVL